LRKRNGRAVDFHTLGSSAVAGEKAHPAWRNVESPGEKRSSGIML
jgi:hypothetical protein